MSDILPTKSNLIKLKKTIILAKQGQELLEKKKYILMKEVEKYISKRVQIEDEFKEQYEKAFYMLQNANVDIGINKVSSIAHNIGVDETLDIKYKTVMGVEIPIVDYKQREKPELTFGLLGTTINLDEAIIEFQKLKKILIDLAEIEVTVKRLNDSIVKVQKRSNSLKDIVIPNYEKQEKRIQETLDERDREEFTRMKMIKKS
ncbi:v-type ATPase D subunit [Clostridium sp. CAG:354]|nr:V-type ATP synthase subunit D [Clostridium sp.]MBS5863429.1 V-type ATP synthase subunit D [Clostridium sp.]MEE0269707.1 V-type ATP synthase subunit D [Clostridia bacterium]CDE10694.1 v-type ATPase D subunit [Clostridium sp. CAG:354]